MFSFSLHLISAKIFEQQPENLNVLMSMSGNEISIKPLLLNKNDYFTVTVLTPKQQIKPNISVRIVGIKTIEKEKKEDFKKVAASYIVLLISCSNSFLFGTLTRYFFKDKKFIRPTFLTIILILSLNISSGFLFGVFLRINNITTFFSWPLLIVSIITPFGFIFGPFLTNFKKTD